MKQLMMARRMFSISVPRSIEASILPKCELDPSRCLVAPCSVSVQSKHHYSSPAPVTSSPILEDKLWSKVIRYSKFRPMPLTIDTFLHHGENSSKEESFNTQ